jgi:hypothetical protein
MIKQFYSALFITLRMIERRKQMHNRAQVAEILQVSDELEILCLVLHR